MRTTCRSCGRGLTVCECEGSYAAVATWLAWAIDSPVSRQQVYTWWRSHATNRFPAGRMTAVQGATGAPRPQRYFKMSDVYKWRRKYVPRNGRPPKEET